MKLDPAKKENTFEVYYYYNLFYRFLEWIS